MLTPTAIYDDETTIEETHDILSIEKIREELLRPDRVQWKRLGDIDGMCCVDGRCTECVAGVPGGEAGLLVATLSTSERPVTDEELDRVVGRMKNAYLHTDEHGLKYVRTALGLHDVPEEDLMPTLRGMAADPRELHRILDVMTAVDAQGCGHLKNMMKDPEVYGTKTETVASVVRAIVRRALTQPENTQGMHHATVHCLEGEHAEQALLIVQIEGEITDDTLVPLVKPNEGGGKREFFVYMPGVAQKRIESIVRMLEEEIGHDWTEDDLRRAKELIQSQTLETAKRLAGGKIFAEAIVHPPEKAFRAVRAFGDGTVPRKAA